MVAIQRFLVKKCLMLFRAVQQIDTKLSTAITYKLKIYCLPSNKVQKRDSFLGNLNMKLKRKMLKKQVNGTEPEVYDQISNQSK